MTLCAPEEAQWPSRESVGGSEELLHFNWVGWKRSNSMAEARPCNTLLQHYVTILCTLDACMLFTNKYYLKLGKSRRKQNA